MNDEDIKIEYHYSDEEAKVAMRAMLDDVRGALGKSRTQLGGPRTPRLTAEKKRRRTVRAARRSNR